MKETKSLGQKDTLDRFYTKREVVQECVGLIDLTSFDVIIEPGAGDGAFLDCLPKRAIGYDIKPAREDIIEQDWFKLDKSQFKGRILVIGNPPFGQQSTLAVRFFNTSAQFANTIAFILPLSFKKDSVQNRLDLSFFLTQERILPENSFLLNDEPYGVPCVFQIWEKRASKREPKKLPTTCDFLTFVDKAVADIRIARVGGNAGKASLDLDKSTASNYFIKNLTGLSNEELIGVINGTIFPSIAFTVGPKSLSKGELIDILRTQVTSRDLPTLYP